MVECSLAGEFCHEKRTSFRLCKQEDGGDNGGKAKRSTVEKAVPSHTAEKTVADTGSVDASIEDFTGPTSRMPCMNNVKERTVPKTTMDTTASQPRNGKST